MFLLDLRILILKSGLKNYQLAQRLGWHSSKISLMLNGTYKPSSMEKEDIAEVLRCNVEDAFPSGKRETA